MNSTGLVSLLAPLMIFIIPIIIIVIITSAISQRGGGRQSRGQGYESRQNGVPSRYAPQKEEVYSRQVNEMHRTDPDDDYRSAMLQLQSLYAGGMVERDEFDERRSRIESEYRNAK